MILLTIGTQLPFDRLVEMLDRAAIAVGDTIFGQIGKNSKYTPKNFEYCEILRPIEFEEKLNSARVIVSHAGIGSILTARKYGKPIIVVPRLAQYGEHRSDHQLATCEGVSGKAGIYIARNYDELVELLKREDLVNSNMTDDIPGASKIVSGLRSFIGSSHDTVFNVRPMEKTDIVIIANEHAVGGAMLNAALMVKSMRERGYNAELIFLFNREPYANLGIENSFVLMPSKPDNPFTLILFLYRFFKAMRILKPAYIFGFTPAASILGALAAKFLGARFVATQRNPADRQSKMMQFIEMYMGRTSLYAGNICVSQTVYDSFSAYSPKYRDKMRVVYNATPELPAVDESKTALRSRFSMPTEEVVLGCIGRLHPQKNVKLAIDALEYLPNYKLFIAGEGPELDMLQGRVTQSGLGDRVRFVGTVRGEDITRFYKAVDLLLFTSIYEGFGRVLVEAMSVGTPIIANDITIAREVGGNAVTFVSADPKLWAIKIEQFLGDRAGMSRKIEAGLSRAREFTLERMVDSYLESMNLPETAGAQN